MTQPNPRKATPSQLRYLAIKRRWTRIRLKAWREMPEKMEAARREATKEAARKRRDKNDGLRQVVATWPDLLTSPQLRERIAADIAYKGKPSSLVYRLRRHGMVSFREDGNWLNLCTLIPREDGQPKP
jgi:hypothetical protein